MKWWKVGILASIAWVVFTVVFAVGLIWFVAEKAFGVKEDDGRGEIVGLVVGGVLGGGLAAIWLVLYIWYKSRENRAAAAAAAELGESDFAPCPACSSGNAQKVTYTWWGGLLGPALFHHVKCLDCGTGFNGRTGKSNALPIAIYLGVSFVICFALMVVAVIAWHFWVA
jgi:hypothetical protein